MKQFSCGAVVPDCHQVFRAPDEAGILGQVADHARDDHGLREVPDEVVAAVRANIVAVPA
jgi:predicted small metal-binding protein